MISLTKHTHMDMYTLRIISMCIDLKWPQARSVILEYFTNLNWVENPSRRTARDNLRLDENEQTMNGNSSTTFMFQNDPFWH